MPPWLLIAILVALVAALAYQLVTIGSIRRLPLYWLLVLAGLLGGQATAELAHLHSPQLGELQVLPDIGGTLAGVFVLWLFRL